MAKPFVYRGEPRDYHFLGRVVDGAIAFFEHRPPDERWQPHEADVATDADVVDAARAQQHDAATAAADAAQQAGQGDELRQPNKAASAEDWKAYAAAHGGFQDATGVHPDDATRKAIVEHYTNEPANESATDSATDSATATEPPAGQPAADTTQE
jgi:hypothetical protein